MPGSKNVPKNEAKNPVSHTHTRSHRDRLAALADTLEAALAEAEPSVKAQLAAQYRATLTELNNLPEVAKIEDPIDEVAARREKRRKSAA